jgi:hypothetical protein
LTAEFAYRAVATCTPYKNHKDITMIPNDSNNESNNNSQNFGTPKRFDIGYYARETAELLHSGWTVASRHMLADRKREQARETRKQIVDLLEEALYDKASRGDTAEVIKGLEYFQLKQVLDQRRDLQPYTLGEHITSVFHSICYLSIVAVILSFTSAWACGGNQSQACKDVRAVSGGVVRYFTDPKL